MILICNRYFGLIARCTCGAIIGYKPEDVNRAQVIRCPVCTNLISVPFDPTYDGLIKESEEKKDGKSDLQKQSEPRASDSGSA